jgi:putative copper export protein
MWGAVLLIHVLAATVWAGGHLVLALAVLPKVLRRRDPEALLRFESDYEPVGLAALVIQVATGLWLAYRMVPDVGEWFAFEHPVARLIGVKLLLLAATVLLAADARLRILPRLSASRLTALAWHIVPVTVIAVLLVFVGVSFRTGWLY